MSGEPSYKELYENLLKEKESYEKNQELKSQIDENSKKLIHTLRNENEKQREIINKLKEGLKPPTEKKEDKNLLVLVDKLKNENSLLKNKLKESSNSTPSTPSNMSESSLRKENDQLKKEKEEMNQIIEEMEMSVDEIVKEKAEIEEERGKLRTRNKELEEEIASIENEVDDIVNQQVEAYKKEILAMAKEKKNNEPQQKVQQIISTEQKMVPKPVIQPQSSTPIPIVKKKSMGKGGIGDRDEIDGIRVEKGSNQNFGTINKQEAERLKNVMEEHIKEREKKKMEVQQLLQAEQKKKKKEQQKIEGGFQDGPLQCPIPLDDIAREFMELENKWSAVGKSSKHFSIAKDPKNIRKNRYPDNIFPYNHNIVKLSKGKYIHASECKINDVTYIVTQWPCVFDVENIDTEPDMWEMIYKYDSGVVISLQNAGRKDHREYWPNSKENPWRSFDSGIIVKYMSHRVSKYFDVYMLKYGKGKKNKFSKKETPKVLQLIIFNVWPDHGVPEDFNGLYDSIKVVNMILMFKKTPAIVHCSAGLGRTGVWIAVHNILHHKWKIDKVMEVVHELRKSRFGMVQNIQQYQFIYDVVYWVNQRREQHHVKKKKKSLKNIKLFK